MTEQRQIKSCDTTQSSPKAIPFLILGCLLLLSSIAIVIFWVVNKPITQPRIQQPLETLVQIEAITPSSNNVIIKARGFVNSKYSATIRSPLTGIVTYVSPKLITGEHVTKGETLLRIEDTDYKAALAQAKQNLANAKSHFLQEQGRSRQAKYDNKRLGIPLTELNLRKPQLEAAKAGLENAKAQLERAKKNFERTTITAPLNGIILSTTASIGELITPASNIAHIASTDTYTLKLRIPHSEQSFLSIGDKAIITNQEKSINIAAHINRFDAGFDKNTRSIGTYVDIEKPLSLNTTLPLESYLTAHITGKEFSQTSWIDNSSIVDDKIVWKKNTDNTISSVPIKVIYRSEQKSLISIDKTTKYIIKQPQSSFYNNQKITTKENISSIKQSLTEQAHEK
ncbi:MAG: efflux RND transporter periplasmic adaptor subunit [Gammaproteobacteria bacterium]|nr:efflux RND transporter periplasmic adaptor subunit [Gammaproteobacteria bacterium]